MSKTRGMDYFQNYKQRDLQRQRQRAFKYSGLSFL